jgi:hypothetical protein
VVSEAVEGKEQLRKRRAKPNPRIALALQGHCDNGRCSGHLLQACGGSHDDLDGPHSFRLLSRSILSTFGTCQASSGLQRAPSPPSPLPQAEQRVAARVKTPLMLSQAVQGREDADNSKQHHTEERIVPSKDPLKFPKPSPEQQQAGSRHSSSLTTR